MRIVLASNNAHKLKELRAILTDLGMDVISMREAGVEVDPEENGTTFEENSYIKAKAVMDICGLPTIADDSGLMVDALNGEPGVYSARYGAESCKTDRDRYECLLKKLETVDDPERTAKFVSVITLLTPDGEKIVARGECPGKILREPVGENGFGYDPVFFVSETGCSFAQLSETEKNKVSHRAKALFVFAQIVRKEQTEKC